MSITFFIDNPIYCHSIVTPETERYVLLSPIRNVYALSFQPFFFFTRLTFTPSIARTFSSTSRWFLFDGFLELKRYQRQNVWILHSLYHATDCTYPYTLVDSVSSFQNTSLVVWPFFSQIAKTTIHTSRSICSHCKQTNLLVWKLLKSRQLNI